MIATFAYIICIMYLGTENCGIEAVYYNLVLIYSNSAIELDVIIEQFPFDSI